MKKVFKISNKIKNHKESFGEAEEKEFIEVCAIDLQSDNSFYNVMWYL